MPELVNSNELLKVALVKTAKESLQHTWENDSFLLKRVVCNQDLLKLRVSFQVLKAGWKQVSPQEPRHLGFLRAYF